MTRRALVLVNPHSRKGAASAHIVQSALADAGYEVLTPENGADAAEEIRRHVAHIDLVVVGGGDGSVNGAMPALLGGSIPLGVIPLGTANDFARTLGIPLDIRQAVQVITAGHVKSVDVGEANGHPFLNVASVGLGVDLTRALTRDSKRRWGAAGYAVAGLRVLRRIRPFTVEIECDGNVEIMRTVHLAIGNGRHYGGGMVVDEEAELDDARLHAFSLEVDHWWKLLRLLPALRNGTHAKWSDVRTFAGKELTVSTRRPRSVNTDGEITTETPVTVRVRPGALRVCVPPLG